MPDQTPQEILRLPYERVLLPEEEGGYSAYITEFEGCIAEGETADEALHNLNQVAIVWISTEQEAGREIPEAWNLQEFSGKLLLRLPKSLHRELARQAGREGISLNQYVVQKLSAGVREDQILAMLHGLIEQAPMPPVQIGNFIFQAETASGRKPHVSAIW
ncbi:MAG: toxin-antitoxin system HicB family antitoxin [Nitrospirae bacterium]|nr:toxin-antitoxin system HicB family antitoxin [Nitrospirota bacterium]